VLTSKLSRRYTAAHNSPLVGPRLPKPTGPGAGTSVSAPDGDCDGDGIPNSVDTDDDNDLLPDSLEATLGTDPCNGDTDGDGVEDGYEYQSAVDLNNDDYQAPNTVIPYPGKRPYPNPLFKDANLDYDGDGLTMATEYSLWKYTYTVNHTSTRTLHPLSYSDGTQYSLSDLQNGTGVRVPTMTVAAYTPPQTFATWALVSGYGGLSLYDMDHNGTVTDNLADATAANQLTTEKYYWDLDNNGVVSDDERDEDGDGLTNYDETIGRMNADYWKGCYTTEAPYPVPYTGTSPVDADSDGDGILDGADDQDNDGVPNVQELSRQLAGPRAPQWGSMTCKVATGQLPNAAVPQGRVNPFNPCMPNTASRTCERHPDIGGQGFAPFDDNGAKYLVLN
jgi:hypothetical protein